jgi:predicted ribosomally synthesized peptide with SipW-like signal peptide
MSDDSKLAITRRRALGGLITFGAASSALGAGTMAYFSDEGRSKNNTITAGDIELETDGDTSATTTVNVGPVAPEDSGSGTTTLNNSGSTDGHLSLEFGTPDTRNDLTEVLKVTVSVAGKVIRRGTFDTVFDGEGEWSNADIPLNAGVSKPLQIDWEVPSGAGNDIQNQEAVGDITINLNQQEEAFADIVVDGTGGGDTTSIQDAVNSAPPGATVLVKDGTYNEEVTISKAGQTLASYNPPGSSSNAVIEADAQNQNKAIRVDGVNNVTVDGFNITFTGGAGSSPNAEKFGLRARAGSDNITVRNCRIAGITTAEDGRDGSGSTDNIEAVRSVGVTFTGQQPTADSIVNPILENTTFQNIKCTGSTTQDGGPDSDSRAKGLAMSGEVKNAAVVRNEFLDIGTAANDLPGAQISTVDSTRADVDGSPGSGRFTTSNDDNRDAEGTDKPRGIDMFGSPSPTNFTILDNTFDGIVGVYGQPAIFHGGSSTGTDNEVYNNEIHHPVDNLGGGKLILRENDWRDNGNYPTLEPADKDIDGGNLIDRSGGSNYDTTFTI